MLDLSTTYLGLPLKHPLMPGASPLVDDLDTVRRLEDAGAAAIVMRSLFEEQVQAAPASTAELAAALPRPEDFALTPDSYFEQIRRIRAAVDLPIIGSINGTTAGEWLACARQIQEAGAAALELNFYHLPTDPAERGSDVEQRLIDLVRRVKGAVTIPVAVKLSPFYSSLPALARDLDGLHVDGLVLFNRFLQPDIDPDMLVAVPRLYAPTADELRLRVRWLAILSGRIRASLAISGGVTSAMDALKAIMAGADAVQIVTALLNHGPRHLTRMRRELEHWLEAHDYESLRQAHASVTLAASADASALARANYVSILQTRYPRSADQRAVKAE
jgi:dihydroorotate dehydrogenase (fumarate)